MREDDLMDLIKALAPNEKRYFKLFAKQHGEDSSQKYLELFDALDSMKEYDPDLLENLIQDERRMKFLNQEKNYLKSRIFDALRAYRGGKSVDSMLYAMSEDMTILYEKGLYGQCLKLLKRAKILAENYDRLGVLVDILSLEQKLTIELKPHDMLQQISRVEDYQRLAMERWQNLLVFQSLWRRLLAVFRQDGYRLEGGKAIGPSARMDWSLLEDESAAQSFAARHFFWLSKSLVARMRGQFEDAVQYYEQLLTMWRNHKGRIDEAAMQYALVVANYLNMQHKCGDYTHFDAHVQELKDMKLDSFGERAELFQNIAHLELLHFLNRQLPFGDLEKYPLMEKELQKGLETYRNKVNASRRLTILHNAMMANFFMENWQQSNRWWIKIDQDEDGKHVRREIYDFSRIMQLLLQYELGEYEWLQNLSKNHLRSLRRGDRMSEFLAIVLDGASAMSRTDDVRLHQDVLGKMHQELQALLQNNDGRNILGSQEVLHWLTWKLSRMGRLYERLPRS